MIANATVLISSLALTAASNACCFRERILESVKDGGMRIVSFGSPPVDIDETDPWRFLGAVDIVPIVAPVALLC
jgi:hypothetical protein